VNAITDALNMAISFRYLARSDLSDRQFGLPEFNL
jgi:hypothetical protein